MLFCIFSTLLFVVSIFLLVRQECAHCINKNNKKSRESDQDLRQFNSDLENS